MFWWKKRNCVFWYVLDLLLWSCLTANPWKPLASVHGWMTYGCGCLHHWMAVMLSLDCCWWGSINNIKSLAQEGWKGLRPRVWIHCGLSVRCCVFLLPPERYLNTLNCRLLEQTMQLSRGSLVASWLSPIPVLGCSSWEILWANLGLPHLWEWKVLLDLPATLKNI